MEHQSIFREYFDKIKKVPHKLRSSRQTLWDKIKTYWNQFEKKPRYEQILKAFANAVLPLIVFCIVLAVILLSSWPLFEKIIATNGFWNFVTVMVSGPIVFLVWKFRDENTAHQLENQRKDVNLKEFQKIAEWVSGLHLVEDKVIEKTKYLDRSAGDNPSEQESSQTPKTDKSHETEISHEFGQPGQSRHIPSHSRQDGAVGLQVAAVYMLKPFYCGEHGDGFRKPALNLLTSAWLALFKQLEKEGEKQSSDRKLDPKELSKSPLAIALTEVLLADGGVHLRRHPEVFPNLYLPYLNLHLPGLDQEEVLQLFVDLDCSGIILEHAKLFKVNLCDAELSNAKLNSAYLQSARLNRANLKRAELEKATLNEAELNLADLTRAKLHYADLKYARLNGAKLSQAKLVYADLFEVKMRNAKLIRAKLDSADLSGAVLLSADLSKASINLADVDRANFYLANLSNIKFENFSSCLGALFDTENIKEIRQHLDEESLTWLIQVPIVSTPFRDQNFNFKRDEYSCVHQLPASLTIEALRAHNPAWTISLADESADTNLL